MAEEREDIADGSDPNTESAVLRRAIKVTLHANRVDHTSVLFARELAEQARTFAEEVERLHNNQINRESKRKATSL